MCHKLLINKCLVAYLFHTKLTAGRQIIAIYFGDQFLSDTLYFYATVELTL